MTATTKAEKVAKTEQLLQVMLEVIREMTSQALENAFRLCHDLDLAICQAEAIGDDALAAYLSEQLKLAETVYAAVDRLSRGQASDEEA